MCVKALLIKNYSCDSCMRDVSSLTDIKLPRCGLRKFLKREKDENDKLLSLWRQV